MSRDSGRRLTVSPRWLALDCVGGTLLVVGILAPTGSIAGSAPALGDPQIAWTLIVVGAGAMTFAAVRLVAELRTRGAGGGGARPARAFRRPDPA